MAYDDPKLPTATLRGEQLFIAGEDEPYFRRPTRLVDFEVNDLVISGGYEQQDITDRKSPRIPTRESLRGKVKLEQGDRFAVGGMNVGEDVPIHFGLRPASDHQERLHWRSHIYFFRWDWERDVEARFQIECHCPETAFADTVAALRGGHVRTLRVSMETMMWTRDKEYSFPGPTRWHLCPPTDREDNSPASESGTVLSLMWIERFGGPASGEKRELPKAELLLLPARLYSILAALVALTAALLLVNLLRH